MFLVFDIGGTHTRIANSPDGETLSSLKTAYTPQDFEKFIEMLKQVAWELSYQKIKGIAVGITGILDSEKTSLVKSPHLLGWVDRPLKERLEKVFNTKVYLENDTALVGLGEATLGAGKGKSIVAYITVSTGVGGVRIVDQKIDKSAHGFEVGHQIILPDGSPCDCGGKGHWETLVAGSYLERIYKQKPEDIKDEAVWNEVTKYLSIGLHNIIVSWSPDIIVLGGSVTESISLEKVKSQVSELLTIFPKSPEIVLATLGDKGGLYGALEYLKSQK